MLCQSDARLMVWMLARGRLHSLYGYGLSPMPFWHFWFINISVVTWVAFFGAATRQWIMCGFVPVGTPPTLICLSRFVHSHWYLLSWYTMWPIIPGKDSENYRYPHFPNSHISLQRHMTRDYRERGLHVHSKKNMSIPFHPKTKLT